MTKKMHAADIAARAAIANAPEFIVVLHRFRNRLKESGFPTLMAADERAAELETLNKPKLCIIYAVAGGTAHPVPADLRAAASAQRLKLGKDQHL